MESRFSGLTRKINLIYLQRKLELPKYTFSSRVYFVKILTNRKKVQSWQRREMYKIAFPDYFSFESWKTFNLRGKNLLSIYISINSSLSFYPVLFSFLTSFSLNLIFQWFLMKQHDILWVVSLQNLYFV